METVTGLDYRALVQARSALRDEAARRYTKDHEGASEALRDGIISEACRRAEDAVFNALNILACYGGAPEAERVVHMREWEEPS